MLGYRDESVRIVDSIPIPICKFGRAHFINSLKLTQLMDIVLLKKNYYGFNLHAITTTDGFITGFVLTPANVDDREAVWELVDTYKSITIFRKEIILKILILNGFANTFLNLEGELRLPFHN